MTVRYEAIREQSIAVGGERVETVLVRAHAVLRGRIDGANRIDSWLARDNGLLVRRRVRSATAVDSPFGKVRDRERYAAEAAIALAAVASCFEIAGSGRSTTC